MSLQKRPWTNENSSLYNDENSKSKAVWNTFVSRKQKLHKKVSAQKRSGKFLTDFFDDVSEYEEPYVDEIESLFRFPKELVERYYVEENYFFVFLIQSLLWCDNGKKYKEKETHAYMCIKQVDINFCDELIKAFDFDKDKIYNYYVNVFKKLNARQLSKKVYAAIPVIQGDIEREYKDVN